MADPSGAKGGEADDATSGGERDLLL